MSKTIEISPLEVLRQIFDSNKGADGTLVISKQLAEQILSAPVVERQEPVAVDEQQALQDRHEAWMAGVEYGKASMVLPERKVSPTRESFEDTELGWEEWVEECLKVTEWNACIDKVKELNQ